jgi:superfamily I DNA/RNA helicase
MKLTDEQKKILDSEGNIKINAVAGSGKTTTLIEYAKERVKGKKCLYIAFNSSVKKYAREKFNSLGLNVRVETAHSLAYGNVIRGSNYLLENNYKTNRIKELLAIKPNSQDRNAAYILANHIKKFAAYYCNSTAEKVQYLDYLSITSDPAAKTFVNNFYGEIEYGTRLFLAKMHKGEININHDFYLKLFQLKNPILNFDYILFDEGQDASPVMLDIFLKQKCNKVIVGDSNQQIYGWRYAINSLEKVKDFKEYFLTTSFRLDREIAALAEKILQLKAHFMDFNSVNIKGLGHNKEIKSKAVIGRTNLKLLINAINLVTGPRGLKKIYFEGNINSYTYAGEGASLYDILYLHEGKYNLIKDELIKSMRDLDDLKEYAEKSEESDLLLMIEVVKEYGSELPKLLKVLKEKHVSDEERNSAEVFFSTVHRCKGLEYDEVTLVKDFINEDSLLKIVKRDDEEVDKANLAEEINLLYVAATRTKSKLLIPEELTDSETKELIKNSKKHVLLTGDETLKNLDIFNTKSKFGAKRAGSDIEEWTPKMDAELTYKITNRYSITVIAKYFHTSRISILKRINQLGLFSKGKRKF